MATIDFDKLKAAYKAGLPIRERITNYSPMDMKNAIGNIVNFARITCASKMKDCENMTEKGNLDLKYGNENNKETDLTSVDFILKEKTEEAKRLLRYSDKSLTAISNYLGFSSQSHFSRVFKKYASCTPGEYREKYTT